MTDFQKNIWIRNCLESPRRHALPVISLPGTGLAGLSAREAFADGDGQLRCLEALLRRFPLEFAMTFMDLSLEAEAFGGEITLLQDEPPALKAPVVATEEGISTLSVPDPARAPGRLAHVFHCVENLSKNQSRPVLAGIIGPYTLACRLMDMTEVMTMSLAEPELLHILLRKATDFLLAYARMLRAKGASGLFIAEPAAGLISPEDCGEFSCRYVAEIVRSVSAPDFMTILHNCGHAHLQTRQLAGTGADALHAGNAADIPAILESAPPTLLVMGNLDPVSVFRDSSADKVYAATTALLEETRPFPNFVLSSGCDLPPGIPMENLDAFFRALEDYNGKS